MERKDRTWLQSLVLLCYRAIRRAGFAVVVLFASFPFPLFDCLAVICGNLGMPFGAFSLATFIGKGLIKPTLQALLTMALLSSAHIESILAWMSHNCPAAVSKPAIRWIILQQQVIAARASDPLLDGARRALLLFNLAMIAGQGAAIIRLLAISQGKREGAFGRRQLP